MERERQEAKERESRELLQKLDEERMKAAKEREEKEREEERERERRERDEERERERRERDEERETERREREEERRKRDEEERKRLEAEVEVAREAEREREKEREAERERERRRAEEDKASLEAERLRLLDELSRDRERERALEAERIQEAQARLVQLQEEVMRLRGNVEARENTVDAVSHHAWGTPVPAPSFLGTGSRVVKSNGYDSREGSSPEGLTYSRAWPNGSSAARGHAVHGTWASPSSSSALPASASTAAAISPEKAALSLFGVLGSFLDDDVPAKVERKQAVSPVPRVVLPEVVLEDDGAPDAEQALSLGCENSGVWTPERQREASPLADNRGGRADPQLADKAGAVQRPSADLASPRPADLASPRPADLASPRTADLASPRPADLASPLQGYSGGADDAGEEEVWMPYLLRAASSKRMDGGHDVGGGVREVRVPGAVEWNLISIRGKEGGGHEGEGEEEGTLEGVEGALEGEGEEEEAVEGVEGALEGEGEEEQAVEGGGEEEGAVEGVEGAVEGEGEEEQAVEGGGEEEGAVERGGEEEGAVGGAEGYSQHDFRVGIGGASENADDAGSEGVQAMINGESGATSENADDAGSEGVQAIINGESGAASENADGELSVVEAVVEGVVYEMLIECVRRVGVSSNSCVTEDGCGDVDFLDGGDVGDSAGDDGAGVFAAVGDADYSISECAGEEERKGGQAGEEEEAGKGGDDEEGPRGGNPGQGEGDRTTSVDDGWVVVEAGSIIGDTPPRVPVSGRSSSLSRVASKYDVELDSMALEIQRLQHDIQEMGSPERDQARFAPPFFVHCTHFSPFFRWFLTGFDFFSWAVPSLSDLSESKLLTPC